MERHKSHVPNHQSVMMRRNHLLYTPYMRGDQATWIIEQSAMERLSIRG